MQGDWQADKAVAKAILMDRGLRRKALAVSLIIAFGFIVLGLWVIDEWLGDAMWRFILWWGVCGLVTIWVLLFALYDALMSIQEEKQKHKD